MQTLKIIIGALTSVGSIALTIAADRSAEHAACTVLDAIADVDKSEASVLELEKNAVASVESRGSSPIAVGEAYLHDVLGLHLEGALSALRHALVAGVLTEPAELAEASSLDTQLSALLSVHLKEPLFFWHGPRRILLPRLRRLLGKETVKQRLNAMSGDCQGLRSTLEPGHVLGGTSDAASSPPVPKILPHKVPHVGLVAGDENCGKDKPCDLTEAIQQAKGLNDEGAIHIILPVCSDAARVRIGEVLRNTPDVWLSAVIPASLIEPKVLISEGISHIFQKTSLTHINLLWLPYAAFTKSVWPMVKKHLETLLKKGSIGAFGITMHIPTSTVIKKIFENREPAPVAWLTNHDVLRPMAKEAAKAAHDLGIAVVAQPRILTPLQAPASVYLGLAVGKEIVDQQAAHLKWMLQSKLGLAIAPSTGTTSVEVLQRLKGVTLSQAALNLLDAVGIFSLPLSNANGADPVQSDANGLEEKLRYWQSKLPKVDSSPTLKEYSDEELRPGLSESALGDLAEQAKTYKSNNHAIYKENFFDEVTYAAIVNETQRLWSSKDIEGNCNLDGRNRLGGYVLDHLSRNSSLYKLVYGNEQFRHWVTEVNGQGTMWPSDFPIELREYGPDSKGMGCHSDLLMYNNAKKDTEFAFTVDNDSKCLSSFVDNQGKEHKILTQPNSMIMVRANAATHCVYPTKSGKRTILKFIYVGDYRKSQEFPNYKGNECGPGNINNQILKARREQYNADSLEL